MPTHSLLRLTASIYNKPHLITPSAFDVILDYLEARNENGLVDPVISTVVSDRNYAKEKSHNNGIGILKVDGSLTYKPVVTMCGEVGTSYTSLVQQVEEMADAGVKTIVMEVTSGGGEASHCFQAADEIRDICDESGIKLVGYADTMACSGAYALISVCDEVIANPSASIGSIGVVVALMDTSKALEKAGLRRIFITAGASKVPFAEDGTFKQEFLNEIQADVDRLNIEFATFVSKHTGLSVETVLSLEAKVFNAEEAVELGLANKIMTNKQFAAYVATLHKGM